MTKRAVGEVRPWKGWQVQRKLYVMGEPWFLRVYLRRVYYAAWDEALTMNQ